MSCPACGASPASPLCVVCAAEFGRVPTDQELAAIAWASRRRATVWAHEIGNVLGALSAAFAVWTSTPRAARLLDRLRALRPPG